MPQESELGVGAYRNTIITLVVHACITTNYSDFLFKLQGLGLWDFRVGDAV